MTDQLAELGRQFLPFAAWGLFGSIVGLVLLTIYRFVRYRRSIAQTLLTEVRALLSEIEPLVDELVSFSDRLASPIVEASEYGLIKQSYSEYMVLSAKATILSQLLSKMFGRYLLVYAFLPKDERSSVRTLLNTSYRLVNRAGAMERKLHHILKRQRSILKSLQYQR
jgi:hypothetical protein